MHIYIIFGILLIGFIILALIYNKQRQQLKAIGQDFSSLKDADEINQRTLEKYQKREKSLDQFFAIVTHDLRGPVGNTYSILQTMLDNPDIYDEETKQEILVALKDSAYVSQNLLNTLSQWSRIQRNKTQFHPEPFEIPDLLRSTLSRVKTAASGKEISIKTTTSSPTLTLNSDISLNVVILQHLLDNAIKFSMPGKSVLLNACKKDKGIEFHIEDSGVGIHEEDFEKILDKETFYFTYGTENEKGPGLGLIIVQEYCKLAGGKFWFESVKDQGSDFYVFIPNHKP